MSSERRCPSCGALVSADAEWCGQCFTPLAPAASGGAGVTEASAPAVAAATGVVPRGIEIHDGRTTWICPTCETRNPIEASTCSVCATPFGQLFVEPEDRPEVGPRSAAMWSLLWPGLGHWRLGLKGDAIARIAMFAWAFGALLTVVISRSGKGGLGPTAPLFLLFLLASVAIYVLSAVDAYRIAAGDPPVVSSRSLLWGSVAVIILSVLIATFVTLPAARR